ncbi:MBL fold metallo-hydrolase [Pendulispora brunnea]|uniref:MBL fold metallo-hydrolase n=1 Tax=Pendulispora brunnea TaxID=2905690 RepID=A0ABZ2K067_9BACT
MNTRKMAVNFARTALLLAMATACATVDSDAEAGSSTGKVNVQVVPGVYRFDVGDFHMTALSDGTVAQDVHKIASNTSQAELDGALYRGYLTNPVEASINVVLIQAGPRLVLVDTGAGELFGPGNGGKLLSALTAAGVRPQQITDILITHIHSDHSGGLVVDGKISFPNAILHLGKPDVDFFLDPANSAKTGYDIHYFNEAIKTVKPYADAGKVRAFSSTTEVLPGITASLHPGHTPGTAFYVAESRGEKITFIGDIVHFGAVQFPNPNVTVVYDLDTKAAAAVRTQQFQIFSQQRMLVAAPHLPFPGIGHVRAEPGGSFAWVPIEYTNRQAK